MGMNDDTIRLLQIIAKVVNSNRAGLDDMNAVEELGIPVMRELDKLAWGGEVGAEVFVAIVAKAVGEPSE